jgi:hypothetical protein
LRCQAGSRATALAHPFARGFEFSACPFSESRGAYDRERVECEPELPAGGCPLASAA